MLANWYNKWQKLKRLMLQIMSLFYHRTFNKTVKKQLKNPKSIPIIIISFNQLYYLKQLVDFLLKHQYQNIVIVDNQSTYPPLINYLESIKNKVTIHYLSENSGHLSFWKHQHLVHQYTKGYYVLTDPDIVPLAECPNDFLNTFRQLLDRAYLRTKVGFSLNLDTIPDDNPNKAQVLNWESQFWKYKINDIAYKAEIDTTFALYRPGYTYKLKNFTKAWRTDYPIQAIHGGWYINPLNLTEEQRYYLQTANESASWQIDNSGTLVNKKHKKLYES